MIKTLLLFLFVLVFSLFALDYLKLVPSDEILSFHNISYLQKRKINNFDDKPQSQKNSVLEKFPFTGKYTQ